MSVVTALVEEQVGLQVLLNLEEGATLFVDGRVYSVGAKRRGLTLSDSRCLIRQLGQIYLRTLRIPLEATARATETSNCLKAMYA